MAAVGIQDPEIGGVPGGGGGAGATDEVVLTFPDTVAPGTAINVQDGTYGGGGPATVEGDTLTLPVTGAEFKADGNWLAFVNGQQVKRGESVSDEEINWSSSTQVSLAFRLRPGNEVTIRKVT